MLDALDYIARFEKKAKKALMEKNLMEAKLELDEAMRVIKNTEFSPDEILSLSIIMKKMFNDYIELRDYSKALEVLIYINRFTKNRLNLTNDLKAILKQIPSKFDISIFDKDLRLIAKNNWEVIELINLLEENYKKLVEKNINNK
ncbi:MAG: hypothetical protein ACP5JT_01545 [Thermoplasmata archaeon]|jgi:hypothetical protein